MSENSTKTAVALLLLVASMSLAGIGIVSGPSPMYATEISDVSDIEVDSTQNFSELSEEEQELFNETLEVTSIGGQEVSLEREGEINTSNSPKVVNYNGERVLFRVEEDQARTFTNMATILIGTALSFTFLVALVGRVFFDFSR